MTTRNFNEVITYTRGTGATRVDPVTGFIVGVDFSVTSHDLTTGSKTFTLDADLGVERSWSIGEQVIAVSQAAPLGSLTGVVTAYDNATQNLTVDVQTVEGTGTATNWRIGSLELRRDADGVVVEPSATNAFINSTEVANQQRQLANNNQPTVAPTIVDSVSPDSSLNAKTITNNAPEDIWVGTDFVTAGVGANGLRSAYFKGAGQVRYQVRRVTPAGTNFNAVLTVESNGVFVRASSTIVDSSAHGIGVVLSQGETATIALAQAEVNSVTSYIPTTTVAVTRAQDQLPLTQLAVDAIKQGEGTLYIEAETADNGLAQKSAINLSGATGDIRVAKQGQNVLHSFRGLVEHQDIIALGSNTANTVSNFFDGKTFQQFNLTSAKRNSPIALLNGSYFASNGASLGHVGNLSDGQTVTNSESVIDANSLFVYGIGVATFNAAHYTGTQFVLPTSTNGLVALTDGDSYRIINDPNITQACNDAFANNLTGRIHLLSSGNVIFLSDTNGESWFSVNTGEINPGAKFYDAVQVGTRIHYAVNNRDAYTDDDGLTFTIAISAIPSTYYGIDYDGVNLVKVGTGGVIAYSTDDGVTWAAATSNTTQNLNAVTHSLEADLWVACGNNGTVLTATDPTGSWTVYDNTTTPSTQSTDSLFAVDYFNGKFYATGNGRRPVIFDPVAVSFAQIAIATAVINVNGIANDGISQITVGTGGGILTTATPDDPASYLSRTNNNATLNGIAANPSTGRFVSVGNAANGSGYIATIDPDGTVTRRVASLTASFSQVRFLRDEFYTVNTGATQYRFNSTSMLERQVAIGLNAAWQDISDDGVNLIIVGQGGLIRYSSDDVTWLASTSNTSAFLRSIASENGKSVSVGDAGVIVVTTDPTSEWVLVDSGTTQTLRSVIYSERDEAWYVAGDNGTLLVSYDNAQSFQPIQDASFTAIDNNGIQASLHGDLWQEGLNKVALAYRNNEVSLSINGSTPVTDTSASIPEITTGVIGDTFNGKIKRVTVKPTFEDPQILTGA